MKQNLFIGKKILTLLVSSFLLLGVHQLSAQTIYPNRTGTHNGFYYQCWSAGSGSCSMTLGSNGNYSVSWSNVGDIVCGKGWQGVGAHNVGYNAGAYQNSGGGSLALYGWTRYPLIEWYVCETWNNQVLYNASYVGSYTCDGSTYNVYKHQQVNKPSIDGTSTFWQFISVRQSQRTAGTITLQTHFNAWANFGLNLGSSHVFHIMATESWNGSGYSNVTVWDAGSSSGGGSSGGGSSSGSYSITVRARGTSGSEQIQLVVGSTTVATWTLSTSMANYTATTSATGGIIVKFINDASNRDVQVDYISSNGVTQQAENQSTNTGVYQNGKCGGSYSEWMHCNGYIGFSPFKSSKLSEIDDIQATTTSEVTLYPNPASDVLNILVSMYSDQPFDAVVYGLNGAIIDKYKLTTGKNSIDVSKYQPGIYFVRMNINNEVITRKFVK